MEPLKEAISVRSARLNNHVLGRNINNASASMKCVAREGLLDALMALYDECNSDILKKSDKNIALFVDKCNLNYLCTQYCFMILNLVKFSRSKYNFGP